MNPIRTWMQPGYFFKGSRQRMALHMLIGTVFLFICLFAPLCIPR